MGSDKDPEVSERVAALRRNLQERKERARDNFSQSPMKAAESTQLPLRQLLTHLRMQWREQPLDEPLPPPIGNKEKSSQLEELL